MEKKMLICFAIFIATGSVYAQSGNVGIGTSAPITKLDVKNSGTTGITASQSNGIHILSLTKPGVLFENSGVATGSKVYLNSIANSGGIGTLVWESLSDNASSQNSLIMSMTPAGSVGIGVANPQAKLHVFGNMILGTANSSSGSNVSTLVRDNGTGEIKVATSSTGNTSPLTYTEYVISNVAGDWINDYDTKIPVSDYVVSIVGSSFEDPLHSGAAVLRTGSLGATGDYNPSNVFAFQSGGTWHLKADYGGGQTAGGYNGRWTIRVLIVNNSLIKIIANQTADLSGANNGSAAAVPAGL